MPKDKNELLHSSHPDVDQDYIGVKILGTLNKSLPTGNAATRPYIRKLSDAFLATQLSDDLINELSKNPENSLDIYNKYAFKQVERFQGALKTYKKQLKVHGAGDTEIDKIISAQQNAFDKHIHDTILDQQYRYEVLMQQYAIDSAKEKIDLLRDSQKSILSAPPSIDSVEKSKVVKTELDFAYAEYGKQLRLAATRFPENKDYVKFVNKGIEKETAPFDPKTEKSAFKEFTEKSEEDRWNMKAYFAHTKSSFLFSGAITLGLATLGVVSFPVALLALGASTLLAAPFQVLREKMGLSKTMNISKKKFDNGFDLTDSNKFVRGIAHVAVLGLQVTAIGGITTAAADALGVGANLVATETANQVAIQNATANLEAAKATLNEAISSKELAEGALKPLIEKIPEWSDFFGDTSTWGGAVDFVQHNLDKLRGIVPPEGIKEVLNPVFDQTILDASNGVELAKTSLDTIKQMAQVALQGSQLATNEIASVVAATVAGTKMAERSADIDKTKNYYRGSEVKAVDAFDDEIAKNDDNTTLKQGLK